MRVFAIGDLHLPGGMDKPMDVFGPAWENHFARIKEAWRGLIGPDDLVLIPGDISWAMHLSDAKADLMAISELPGKKVILRGNHDYWWSSLKRVRETLPPGMYALQNDAFGFGDVAIAGARGWVCPGSALFKEETDRSIYEREVIRLGLSLEAAKGDRLLIGMLHFPPMNEKRQASGFTELFEAHGTGHVVYAHLHEKACRNAFEGMRNGIQYSLCSADYLGFAPKLIAQL